MKFDFIHLVPDDGDPIVKADRGVALMSSADRRLHAADISLLLVDHDVLLARCSCWWRHSPVHEGRRVGIIGHYAAADFESARALLEEACRVLGQEECETAVGPMDGSTWRRYRFIIERGDEPVFFLEPDNLDEWPGHWRRAGFQPLATYTSALNDDLAKTDPRTDITRARLASSGITIRPFDMARKEGELLRMFELSTKAFSRNFLYTPLSQPEFLAQQTALLTFVRPELVLMAEDGGRLVGFMFAVPDALEARRGGAGTVIMKTLAVDPASGGMGLGGALFDLAQRSAHALGFRRAIHALIHETNVSGRISGRYARTIRRYALFSRALSA